MLHNLPARRRGALAGTVSPGPVRRGGRSADCDKITTGAESDLQPLTQIARSMVGRWGMSDKFGPLTLLPSDGEGPFLPGSSETSPQTESLIDQDVQQLVERLHAETIELLTTHRAQLEGLAEALLLAETLDAPAAYARRTSARGQESQSQRKRRRTEP